MSSCWNTVTMIDGKWWDRFEVVEPPNWKAYISQLAAAGASAYC
jgi:hypothetical protein